MIKSKDGRIKIKGTRDTIRADLICIFRALIEKEIDDLIGELLEDIKTELEELTK